MEFSKVGREKKNKLRLAVGPQNDVGRWKTLKNLGRWKSRKMLVAGKKTGMTSEGTCG